MRIRLGNRIALRPFELVQHWERDRRNHFTPRVARQTWDASGEELIRSVWWSIFNQVVEELRDFRGGYAYETR